MESWSKLEALGYKEVWCMATSEDCKKYLEDRFESFSRDNSVTITKTMFKFEQSDYNYDPIEWESLTFDYDDLKLRAKYIVILEEDHVTANNEIVDFKWFLFKSQCEIDFDEKEIKLREYRQIEPSYFIKSVESAQFKDIIYCLTYMKFLAEEYIERDKEEMYRLAQEEIEKEQEEKKNSKL